MQGQPQKFGAVKGQWQLHLGRCIYICDVGSCLIKVTTALLYVIIGIAPEKSVTLAVLVIICISIHLHVKFYYRACAGC